MTELLPHPKKVRVVNKNLINAVRKLRCAATGRFGSISDPVVVHHLITVGARGPDLIWNLMPVLNSLHTPVIHVIGISKMARRYHKFYAWLKSHGWEYDAQEDHWSHSREDG